MFRESMGSVVRQRLHSSFLFSLSVAQTAKRPALAQGATRKDVDVGFLFNSYPSKGAKPPQKNNPKTYRYIVIKGLWVSRVFASCMSLQNNRIQVFRMDMGSMALITL